GGEQRRRRADDHREHQQRHQPGAARQSGHHTLSTRLRPNRPLGSTNRVSRMTMNATASLYLELIMPALNCSITPTSSPPTTAPSGLPMPPSMAAAKPFSASKVPTS